MVESQISDTKNKAVGPLKITVSNFLGANWLAPKVKDLINEFPDLKLTILTDNKILNLSMREADAAIRMYEPHQQDLIKRKLTEIRFHICGSKSYFEKHGKPEKPIDLLEHTLIGYPNGVPYPHEHIDWIFQLAGVDKERTENVLLMNSMIGIENLVRGDLGLACLPDFMIKSSDDLVPVLNDYEAPPIEIFFVYPEERRNSARIKAFRDFMLKQVKNIS
jgi:DNA-binding transcriptional LysR family regulator